MNLHHSSLPAFEPILSDLHHYAFHAGIDALQERGLLRNDRELHDVLHSNPSAVKRFFRGCHYGFDLTQRKAGKLVIEYELLARENRAKLKQARGDRNSLEEIAIENLLDCLNDRQLVLRRLIDSILWQMVNQEPWILRRTQLSDEISPIDPVVLERTLATAGQLNKENRKCIHIVSDLTTSVQIGDLVRLCIDSNPRRWEIIELKEGRVNEELLQLIGDKPDFQERVDDEHIEQGLGKKSVAQARRMVRQKEREAAIQSFRANDTGVDPQTKEVITLSPKSVEVDDYFGVIKEACYSAKTSGASTVVVSDCLRLLAVSEEYYAKQGPRGIAHALFHLEHNKTECKLSVPEERGKEIEAIEKIWPFLDLVRANFQAQWPAPIFMWPMKKELIFDLIFERSRVYAQLNFDRLFSVANARGLQMTWLRQKDTKGVVSTSPIIPGSPQSRAVLAKIPGIHKHGSMQLMNGSFARIFLEMMPPSQLLTMTENSIRRLEDQVHSHNNEEESD